MKRKLRGNNKRKELEKVKQSSAARKAITHAGKFARYIGECAIRAVGRVIVWALAELMWMLLRRYF